MPVAAVGQSNKNAKSNENAPKTSKQEKAAVAQVGTTTDSKQQHGANSHHQQQQQQLQQHDKRAGKQQQQQHNSAKTESQQQQQQQQHAKQHAAGADKNQTEAGGNEVQNKNIAAGPSDGKKEISSGSSSSFCVEDIDDSTSIASAMSNGLTVANTNSGGGNWGDDGWKEVVRKYLVPSCRPKRVSVPSHAISRVIGRGGCNINAIRSATGANIEVEKQKGQGDRTIFIKGSAEASRQAHMLISALIDDPDADIMRMLPKPLKSTITTAAWDNNNKSGGGSQQTQKGGSKQQSLSATTTGYSSAAATINVTPAVKSASTVQSSVTPIISQAISSFSKPSFPTPQSAAAVASVSSSAAAVAAAAQSTASTFAPVIRASSMTITRPVGPRAMASSASGKWFFFLTFKF